MAVFFDERRFVRSERAKLDESFDDERRHGTIVAVGDFDAHPDRVLDIRRGVKTFGAAFAGDVRKRRAHEVGVEAAGAGDVLRIVHHRAPHALERFAPATGQFGRVGELREERGADVQRHGDGRDSATIDADDHARLGNAEHLRASRQDRALREVVRREIVLDGRAEMDRQRENA